MSIGAPAAAFVQRHQPQLFTTTPMLLTVVEQRRVGSCVLSAMTPFGLDQLFGAIENILRVLPNTKNVAVVTSFSH